MDRILMMKKRLLMKKRLFAATLILVAGGVILLLTAVPVIGQAQAGETRIQVIPSRMPDGKPDFTGVWAGPGFAHLDTPYDRRVSRRLSEEELEPYFRPGAKDFMYREFTGNPRLDDPTSVCLPSGMPRAIFSAHAQQWIQRPNYLVILYEYEHWFRTIPLDGRPHPQDLEGTWMGHSVGRWEGDTLVIDTVGLKEWPLDGWSNEEENIAGRWHSDRLHLIERIRYTSPADVSYELTIDDPVLLTEPIVRTYAMKLKPTWELYEYVCAENNRCAGGSCEDYNEFQTTAK